jgi:hypothetical protein
MPGSTSGTVNSARNEQSPVRSGLPNMASSNTGPDVAGSNRMSGPDGGQGGPWTYAGILFSSAFHQSWRKTNLVWNVPVTSTDDPTDPEADERMTGGGLSPDGVGHSIAAVPSACPWPRLGLSSSVRGSRRE